MMPPWLGSGESSPPGLQRSLSLLTWWGESRQALSLPLRLRPQSCQIRALPLLAHFTVVYLLKILSPDTVILGLKALAYSFGCDTM